ncbi:MAG: FAD:protein FMN transferase [Gammaproteobacteria bacterium]|nr:FAD:protein FMN transferase [Gammaproteobacteria bacterium]
MRSRSSSAIRSPSEPGAGVRRRFTAMASPCEVLVDTDDRAHGLAVAAIAEAEARRVEAKFTRYANSPLSRLNAAAGTAVTVDAEMAELLDFAACCHALSDGRFDVTSGVLRRAWRFDGSDRIADPLLIAALLPLVGWEKLTWRRPVLTLRPGMELDFGGIGKEYAVDRALVLAARAAGAPLLVNLGGDLRASGPRADGTPWQVAIADVDDTAARAGRLALACGALATSGDAHRYVERGGRRYGHLLDPCTGWPIDCAPRAVTVAAASCLEAGLLAKLALLAGADAERFLAAEGLRAWCLR